MNDRQALSSENRFQNPRRGWNPQPSDDRWDALTIELPRLSWRAKVQIRLISDLSKSHYMLIMIWNLYFRGERAWRYLEMIKELSLSSIPGKTIYDPQTRIEPTTFLMTGNGGGSNERCGFDPDRIPKHRFEVTTWCPFNRHLNRRCLGFYCWRIAN